MQLFDLMQMAFKYQVMSASCCEDLAAICHNHLTAMEKMVPDDAALGRVIVAVDARLAEVLPRCHFPLTYFSKKKGFQKAWPWRRFRT